MTIKVVRGNPTPEELAATLAVVRARAAAAAAEPSGAPRPRDSWSDPA
ncbi:acyl-CoA carboxylase subunit epsilon, partial [Streptomyces sp. SID14446]